MSWLVGVTERALVCMTGEWLRGMALCYQLFCLFGPQGSQSHPQFLHDQRKETESESTVWVSAVVGGTGRRTYGQSGKSFCLTVGVKDR